MKNIFAFSLFALLSFSVFSQNNTIVREEYFKGGVQKLIFEQLDNELVRATYYHENGVVAEIGYYQNKQLFGYWQTFDFDANKIASGFYRASQKVGDWNYWKSGELIQIVSYSSSNMAVVTN